MENMEIDNETKFTVILFLPLIQVGQMLQEKVYALVKPFNELILQKEKA